MRMVRRVNGFSELSFSSLCSVFRVQKVSLQYIYAVRIKIRTAVFIMRRASIEENGIVVWTIKRAFPPSIFGQFFVIFILNILCI